MMKVYVVALLALAMGTLCCAQKDGESGCNGCKEGRCIVRSFLWVSIYNCASCEEGFTRATALFPLRMVCIAGDSDAQAGDDSDDGNGDSSSQVTSQVFDAVLAGDTLGVAAQLESSDDVEALAKGFTFPPERRSEILEKTADRRGDPDVVSMKAFAQAATSITADPSKLSEVMTLALYPKGNETVRSQLTRIFGDTDLMQRISDADPAKEFVPGRGSRRLLCDGCSPVESFICAHCWTNVVCSVNHWC